MDFLKYKEKTVTFSTELIHQFASNRCLDSAAALTLATLFGLVPIITVLYSILAMIPALQTFGQQIQDWAFQHLAPATGVEVQQYLESFSDQARKLTSVGVAMLFVTVILMLRRIELAFNIIWRVRNPRKGVMSFLRYWAILSLGPVLLGLGLVMTSYVASIELLSETIRLLDMQRWGLNILPFVASWAAFSLLNLAAPNCLVPINHAMTGGMVAAFGFELAKKAFTLFVTHFPSYQVVYGAFALLPLFIIWIYTSWVIVLLGAVLCRVLTTFKFQPKTQSSRLAAVLEVLRQFWLAQKSMVTLQEKDLRSLVQVPLETWENIRDKLRTHGLIQKTEEGGFVLTGDLRQISVAEVLTRYAELPDFSRVEPQQPAHIQTLLQTVGKDLQARLSLSLDELYSQENPNYDHHQTG